MVTQPSRSSSSPKNKKNGHVSICGRIILEGLSQRALLNAPSAVLLSAVSGETPRMPKLLFGFNTSY